MSFDFHEPRRRKIAIVGGGISGMAAAFLLASDHDITLYEAEPRLGGHARTVLAGRDGTQPVDTGFIVFNYVNYPHLTRLFRDLKVPVKPSDMSFGASVRGGALEYSVRSLSGLAAQPTNFLRPRFWAMLRGILRFGDLAEARLDALAADPDVTIDAFLAELRLSSSFRDDFLFPMCAAIWSTPASHIGTFPAATLVRFFRNHGLFRKRDQHAWWTVDGGSAAYVSRLETWLRGQDVAIRTRTPVQSVTRSEMGVCVRSAGDESRFDDIVFACHADQTLRLLADPSPAERAALGKVTFQDNRVVLHCDPDQMPRSRAAWASWVYTSGEHQEKDGANGVAVSYWMNRLQSIPESDPMFITLNPRRPIPDALVYDDNTFRHPVFDRDAISAQGEIAALQGLSNTWYAGAWMRNGFHEDGFASAARVARGLGSVVA